MSARLPYDDELEDIRRHLLACDAWEPNLGLPPLTDTDREEVHARIDDLATERLERQDAHRDRLRQVGFYLGREVAAHRTTLDDAQKRLDRLAAELDPAALVPMVLVEFDEACQIAHGAFIEGYGAGDR